MKKNKNRLPFEIKYCVKYNILNQRPTSVNKNFHTNTTEHSTVEFDDKRVVKLE